MEKKIAYLKMYSIAEKLEKRLSELWQLMRINHHDEEVKSEYNSRLSDYVKVVNEIHSLEVE